MLETNVMFRKIAIGNDKLYALSDQDIRDIQAVLLEMITDLDALCRKHGLTYFLCGTMDTTVGLLRGMGASVMPMVVSIVGVCVFRIVWILAVFPLNPTLTMLYISYPISWVLTFAAHLACYFYVKRKKFG